MTTLIAMNFERYLGIIHPLVHRVKLTKKRLCCFVASVCGILPTVFNTMKIRRLVVTISVLIFLISTAYFYIRIFLAAKNSRSFQNPPNAIAGEESTTKKKNLKEIKLAKSCFTIVILFVFNFLQISVLNILTA